MPGDTTHAAGRQLEGARLARQATARPNGEPQRETTWSFSDVPDASGAIFRALDPEIAQSVVHLVSTDGDHLAVAPFLGQNIESLSDADQIPAAGLTPSQHRLLTKVRGQIGGAKHGVFPWNLESYADVDIPPPDLESPLTSLYCVAAGFKPYRILHTHGFDRGTLLGDQEGCRLAGHGRYPLGGLRSAYLIWDAADLHKKLQLESRLATWERSFNWTPDGSGILAGTFDGTVLEWDAAPASACARSVAPAATPV